MTACATPLPYESLAAYWSAELHDSEEETFERHLFECEHCARALAAVAAVIEATKGLPAPILTPAIVEGLKGAGVRVSMARVEPGGAVEVPFPADADLVVSLLRAPIADADRIDCVVTLANGAPLIALDALTFDSKAEGVLIACSRHMFERNTSGAIRVALTVRAKGSPPARYDFDLRHVAAPARV